MDRNTTIYQLREVYTQLNSARNSLYFDGESLNAEVEQQINIAITTLAHDIALLDV